MLSNPTMTNPIFIIQAYKFITENFDEFSPQQLQKLLEALEKNKNEENEKLIKDITERLEAFRSGELEY